MRCFAVTVVAVLVLLVPAGPVGAGAMTAQRKHELQRRYWHATGVVRWIGAHAAVTQYHPEPARKARWQAAVRFWNRVRRSVWAQLHPRPSPRPLVDGCLHDLI